MSDSPSDSYYDPPEPRHADNSRIPDECNCSECHQYHVEEGEVEENSDNTDYQCCVDQMDNWIEDGTRCEKHPKSYAEVSDQKLFDEKKFDDKGKRLGFFCEECESFDEHQTPQDLRPKEI